MRALFAGQGTSETAGLARNLRDLGYSLIASGPVTEALAAQAIPYEEQDPGDAYLSLRQAGRDGARYDLVVCTLDQDGHADDAGTTDLIRQAALHPRIGVVVDPTDYPAVLDGLREKGQLSETARRQLARTALARVAAYDAALVTRLDEHDETLLPPTLHLTLVRAQELRYGENPHQKGARYREAGRSSWWDGVTQHSGMALSYLNLFDAEAAWQLVHELGATPAATIIKHANPCGVAIAETIFDAYERAFACDPTSAFGGIVALNRPVSADLAAEMVANPKADVVIAPGYDAEALALFAKKRKNTRILEAPAPGRDSYDLRRIHGGFLVQDSDRITIDRAAWQVVTKATPTEEQWRDLELAWIVCAYVKSNAIVFVANGQAVGIGAGQQSRVDAAEIAARKAGGRARGGACASDALFPFRDGLDVAAQAGVAAVIQPGGSIRDAEVITAADEQGIAMVFTGTRHFRH